MVVLVVAAMNWLWVRASSLAFCDRWCHWLFINVAASCGMSGYSARARGIPVQESFAEFHRASDLMGLQRHLKVIGIFARICHRDGKPRYLGDVPRFFAYLDTVLERRPELADLKRLLQGLPQEPTAS